MSGATPLRARREPPPFRRVRVRRIEELGPRMRGVVLAGPELEGFPMPAPAASVRLLLPPDGARGIVMPTWTGNQFVLPGGERAPIRTFTPRRFDPDRQELAIDIVLHERGAASDWARQAGVGDEVAVSGPGRGFDVDPTASGHLLVGDETAIAAISQLLEAIPGDAPVRVEIEIVAADGRIELPPHEHAEVTWHERPARRPPGEAMVAAVQAIEELPEVVWIAGEAASVQRLRKHLFDGRGLPRSRVTARGYWKHGRSAT